MRAHRRRIHQCVLTHRSGSGEEHGLTPALLEAHRLPVAAAYIRKHSGIASLEVQPGDEGMTHIVHCARCRKSTGGLDVAPGEAEMWWCKKCRHAARICSVCHSGVRGLWMGCGRCKHGGHQKCMRLYFRE